MKLLGLGFRQYWRDLWNRYDLLLVLASMASGLGTTITRFTGYATPPLNLGFLRALRVLRLGKSIRSFRLLLLTLTLPGGTLMDRTRESDQSSSASGQLEGTRARPEMFFVIVVEHAAASYGRVLAVHRRQRLPAHEV